MSEIVYGDRECPCGCGEVLVDEPANRRQEYASSACRERVRRKNEASAWGSDGHPRSKALCRCGVELGGTHKLLPGEEWEETIDRWGRNWAWAPHVPEQDRLTFPPPTASDLTIAERVEGLRHVAEMRRLLGDEPAARRAEERAHQLEGRGTRPY